MDENGHPMRTRPRTAGAAARPTTARPSTATHWSVHQDRCHLCNAVGGLCPCPKAKADPGLREKARNYGNALSRGPIALTKAKQLMRDCDSAEASTRAMIASEEDVCFDRVMELARADRALVDLVADERACREGVKSRARGSVFRLHCL